MTDPTSIVDTGARQNAPPRTSVKVEPKGNTPSPCRRSDNSAPRRFSAPSSLRIALRLVLFIAIVLFFARYVYLHAEDLSGLLHIRCWMVAALIGTDLMRRLADAARLAALYRAVNVRFGLLESFGLSQVVRALNLIIPGPSGATLRTAYAKSRYAVPYSYTPAVLFFGLVLSFLIGGVLVLLSCTVQHFGGNHVPGVIWAMGGLATMTASVLWVPFPTNRNPRSRGVARLLGLFATGWERLRTNRSCLVQTSLYQLLAFIVSGTVYMVACRALGIHVSAGSGIAIAVLTSFSNAISITPGNLGIQETVIAYLSQVSGLRFIDGLIAAALIRATGLVLTFVMAPIAWYALFVRGKREGDNS